MIWQNVILNQKITKRNQKIKSDLDPNHRQDDLNRDLNILDLNRHWSSERARKFSVNEQVGNKMFSYKW